MNIISLIGKTRFVAAVPTYARLILRLFRDARVPLGLKLSSAAAALVLVSPLDPLADIPFLNLLDDAVILAIAARIFLALCPSDVVAEHRAAVGLEPVRARIKDVTPR